jgi:hypothetical protein
MEEIRNYPEPTIPQPPSTTPPPPPSDGISSWWEAELHADDQNRPVTMEYTPVWYNRQTNDPMKYEWVSLEARWVRHFPLQNGPWDHFVTYKDINLGYEEQVILPNGSYQVICQFDKTAGAINLYPHPSNVNYVGLGDVLKIWGDGRIDLTNGLTVKPNGVLLLGQPSVVEQDGQKYWKVIGPDGKNYGVPLTPLR